MGFSHLILFSLSQSLHIFQIIGYIMGQKVENPKPWFIYKWALSENFSEWRETYVEQSLKATHN